MEVLRRLSNLAIELQRGAYREATPAFADWALEALKAHLPFDSAIWASGFLEPGHAPVVHSAHLHRQPAQLLVDYQAVGGSDALIATAVSNPGVSFADTPANAPPHLLAYLKRYRIAQGLATCAINSHTALITAISLWRSDPDRPFTDEERQFKEAAFPHLIEARTQNQLFALVNATMPRLVGPWRSAAADPSGLLHHADEEFVRLLLTERPDWKGPYLPDSIKHALLRRSASRLALRNLVFKLSPMGDLVLVQARTSATLDKLTAREREVATYTAQGLTHKEIARLLGLSPATVRTHLATSCRRIGVKNKAQLAALVSALE